MQDDMQEANLQQQIALYNLNDEIMSCLHAQQLRSQMVESATVTDWLRRLHDMVQEGLDKPRHFNPFPADAFEQ